MEEKRNIIITFNGKEVREKQLLIRSKKQGMTEYYIANKKVSVVLHTNGVKNIIAVENQYGNIIWAGTYSTDVQLRSIDLVVFTDDYMSRFNCASVVTTEGKRYQVPKFNYFETELLPETSTHPWDDAEDEEIAEVAEEITAEEAEEIAEVEAQAQQMQAVEQTISDLKEHSGLTE